MVTHNTETLDAVLQQVGQFAADLANSTDPAKGAAIVGYDNRTLRERLQDRVSVKDFGAIGDGTTHPLSEFFGSLAAAQARFPHATALTQEIDWAAIQAALDSGYIRIDVPDGRYLVNDNLSRQDSLFLDGSGVIVMDDGFSITVEGSLTSLPALGADISKTSRDIVFGSAPSLIGGDVIVAYNPTDYSWSPHRAYYRDGEFYRVHSLRGSTATVYGLPADDHTAADIDMYRMDGVRVVWGGVEVEGHPNTTGPIVVIRHGIDCDISALRISGGSSYGLELDRCFHVDLFGGAPRNSSAYAGDEYGILVSNSSQVTVNGGAYMATRHSIALGGGDGVGCVPCRDILIANAVLTNSGDDIGAADIHGNCDRVTYSNCAVNAHANMAGRDVTYSNCRIMQRTGEPDGSCIFGSEVVGGTYKIIDCTLVTYGNGASFGYVYLGMTQPLRNDLNVIVRNLTVSGGSGGATAKLVQVSPFNGETKKINVDIRGVVNLLAQSIAVLWYRCESNTAFTPLSDGIVVDDIRGPAGMHMAYPTGAAYTGIPLREMRQSGKVDVTTAVGVAAVASPVTLRYPYNKAPVVTVVPHGSGGGATTYIAGQPASPVMYTVTNAQVRPAIVAPANFTAGTTISLNWSTAIEEL
jgi:hypothetical protein